MEPQFTDQPQPIQSTPPTVPQSDSPQPGKPPHKVQAISIVGLVFAFIFLAPIGLILSIIGLIRAHRSKQPDIVALLGVIFNSIAVVIIALAVTFGVLTLIAYDNVRQTRTDTYADMQHQAAASKIAGSAETYRLDSDARTYPRIDKEGYTADIASLNDTYTRVRAAITDQISTDSPSADNTGIYHISYCGGTDQATATGIEVEYWSVQNQTVEYETTGVGCTPPYGKDGTNNVNENYI